MFSQRHSTFSDTCKDPHTQHSHVSSGKSNKRFYLPLMNYASVPTATSRESRLDVAPSKKNKTFIFKVADTPCGSSPLDNSKDSWSCQRFSTMIPCTLPKWISSPSLLALFLIVSCSKFWGFLDVPNSNVPCSVRPTTCQRKWHRLYSLYRSKKITDNRNGSDASDYRSCARFLWTRTLDEYLGLRLGPVSALEPKIGRRVIRADMYMCRIHM